MAGHKCSSKTWRPTVDQLQKLLHVYNNETQESSRDRIESLVIELSMAGEVTYSNIYNCFKNRRTRNHDNASTTSRIGSSLSVTCVKSMHVYDNSAALSFATHVASHDGPAIISFINASHCFVDVLGVPPTMHHSTHEKEECSRLVNTDSAVATACVHILPCPSSLTRYILCYNFSMK